MLDILNYALGVGGMPSVDLASTFLVLDDHVLIGEFGLVAGCRGRDLGGEVVDPIEELAYQVFPFLAGRFDLE